MTLNPKSLRRLEIIAYEETHSCANELERSLKREQAFKYIHGLTGEQAYLRGAYIRKYYEMTSANAWKCVVSDYEKGSPQQKIGDFTQTKIGGFS